ncbi:MAG: hypothetical protein JO020_24005 [Chloroflexi bacterium]|nr:hypothetical protein [Chloroflexota bacterium]
MTPRLQTRYQASLAVEDAVDDHAQPSSTDATARVGATRAVRRNMHQLADVHADASEGITYESAA